MIQTNDKELVKDIIFNIYDNIDTLIKVYNYKYNFKGYKTAISKVLYFLKIYIDDLYLEGLSKQSGYYLTPRLGNKMVNANVKEPILSLRYKNIFTKHNKLKDLTFYNSLLELDLIFKNKVETAKKNNEYNLSPRQSNFYGISSN